MKNKILKVILGLAIVSVMGCGEANTHIDRIPSKLKYINLDNESKTNINNQNNKSYEGTFKIDSKNPESINTSFSITGETHKMKEFSGYLTLRDNEKDNFLLDYKLFYKTDSLSDFGNDLINKNSKININKNSITIVDSKTLKISDVSINNKKYSIQMHKMFDRVGDINEIEYIEINKNTNKGLYPIRKPGPLCDSSCMDGSCMPDPTSAGRCSDIDAMLKYIGTYQLNSITSGCTNTIDFTKDDKNAGLVEAIPELDSKGNVKLTITMNIQLSNENKTKCEALLKSNENTSTNSENRFYYKKVYFIDLNKFGGLPSIFPAVGLNSIPKDFFYVNFHTKKQDNKGEFTDLLINGKKLQLKLAISENASLNDKPTLEDKDLITQ